MHVGGEAIDVENLAPAETLAIIHKWRIEAAIQRVGLHEAVIGHPEAAANDQATAELVVHDFSRAPGETQLRAKIALLRIVERPAGTNPDVGKNIGAGAENDGSKLAILLRDGSKIFPAQSRCQRQIGSGLPVVLVEEGDDVGPEVFPQRGRDTRFRVELRIL